MAHTQHRPFVIELKTPAAERRGVALQVLPRLATVTRLVDQRVLSGIDRAVRRLRHTETLYVALRIEREPGLLHGYQLGLPVASVQDVVACLHRLELRGVTSPTVHGSPRIRLLNSTGWRM